MGWSQDGGHGSYQNSKCEFNEIEYLSKVIYLIFSCVQIMDDAQFEPAVNIPAYDIGTINNDLKISFPGSDYTGVLNHI